MKYETHLVSMYMTEVYNKAKKSQQITLKELLPIFKLTNKTPLEACLTLQKLNKISNNIPCIKSKNSIINEYKGNTYALTELKNHHLFILSIALTPYGTKPESAIHIQIDFNDWGKILAYGVPDFFLQAFQGLKTRR